MTKTITITDPMQVKTGDKAYFKGCDFGFTVDDLDTDDEGCPIVVCNPLSGLNYWASLSQFDHATREVKGTETTIINDANKVREGDVAHFTSTDITSEVIAVDHGDQIHPFAVLNPFGHGVVWAHADVFDHATREVKGPEWPDPHDIDLHVYLGANGVRYIYNPCSKKDTGPWAVECSIGFRNRQLMASIFPEALPLTELELIPKERES